MSEPVVTEQGETAEHVLRGRTVLTGRALQRLAVGVVRDVARVPVRDVSVSLSDSAGSIRAEVRMPVAIGSGPGDPLAARGDAARRALIDGMRELAGRRMSSVDVRYSGVRRDQERRVL